MKFWGVRLRFFSGLPSIVLDNARLIEPSLLTTMVRALERIGVLVLIQPVAIAGWNIAKPENRRLDF